MSGENQLEEAARSAASLPFRSLPFSPISLSALRGCSGAVNLMVQAYCVKCKAKREMKDAAAVTLKNGKPAMKGKCPVCGTTIMRIGAAK